MSQQQQEFEQLRQTIEALRLENQKLKAAAGLPLNGHRNGHGPAQDPTLKALTRQFEAVRELRAQGEAQVAELKKAEQALAALIPALEVEWRGLRQQAQQYRQQIDETESTYASVVEKLEHQLRDLRFDMKSELQRQQQTHDAAKLKLQRRLAGLEEELESARHELIKARTERQEAPERPYPFSNLSIFEA